jgi:GH24 family phage-related lysozyme (muramidase)
MLDPAEKLELKQKKIQYEGYVTHMYLDSKGYVTAGIGHMMPNAIEAQKVKFMRADGSPAFSDEISAEFNAVKSFNTILKAYMYKRITKLYLTDEEINRLTNNHLSNFYTGLKRIYPEFDDYPKNVRFALFDMIYNLGEGGLRDKFPNFNKAIKTRAWAEAADQSSRKDVNEERKQYVAGLLRSEAGISIAAIPNKSQTSEELKEPQKNVSLNGKKPIPVKIHKNNELKKDAIHIFPDYEIYPMAAQLGIIDMISTLGVNGLKIKFPKFMRAVFNRDWLTASRECSRKNQKETRNKFISDLFKAAYPGKFQLLIRN